MLSDPDELRKYYASLPDEALMALTRTDLTSSAQGQYDAELAARGIEHGDPSLDGQPQWVHDAACACSFVTTPGDDSNSEVDATREILNSAGIPCSAVMREGIPGSTSQGTWELMVPSPSLLHAMSILDKEYFNPELESEWKAHFAALSDEDLRGVKLEDLTAGLQDRIERLTRAYHAEHERRGL